MSTQDYLAMSPSWAVCDFVLNKIPEINLFLVDEQYLRNSISYLRASCNLAINGVPGVMQLLSKRASVGKTSPFSFALASSCSASLAEQNLKNS